MTLLNEPSLLILYEPTNGLDPNGMIELMDLLLKLNRERGITIVISSHLLNEIENIVSHIGIINEGSLLFQGTTLEELQRERTTGACLKLNTSNNSTALYILRMRHSKSKIENDMIRLPMLDRQNVATILRELIESGIEILELSPEKHNLETIFMGMITK